MSICGSIAGCCWLLAECVDKAARNDDYATRQFADAARNSEAEGRSEINFRKKIKKKLKS
jgi:hypothetical protein